MVYEKDPAKWPSLNRRRSPVTKSTRCTAAGALRIWTVKRTARPPGINNAVKRAASPRSWLTVVSGSAGPPRAGTLNNQTPSLG